MNITIGGETHCFFDPTPREIDLLFRSVSGIVGTLAVTELHDGQLENLYKVNGWRQTSVILNPAGYTSERIIKCMQAVHGNIGSLIGPALQVGEYGAVGFWVPKTISSAH